MDCPFKIVECLFSQTSTFNKPIPAVKDLFLSNTTSERKTVLILSVFDTAIYRIVLFVGI